MCLVCQLRKCNLPVGVVPSSFPKRSWFPGSTKSSDAKVEKRWAELDHWRSSLMFNLFVLYGTGRDQYPACLRTFLDADTPHPEADFAEQEAEWQHYTLMRTVIDFVNAVCP